MKEGISLYCKLTFGERLKDLRDNPKRNLEEVSAATGISVSTLSSYENMDSAKSITAEPLIKLCEYYGISADYLLGLTENREQHIYPVDELGFDDYTIDILHSKSYNNRLIAEIIKDKDFSNLISDMEIYVDNLAGMQIRNMNTYVEQTRILLKEKQGISDSDHYMKTLEAARITEDNYFANLLGNDIHSIAKTLRATHEKDSNTGDTKSAADEFLNAFEEMQKSDNSIDSQLLFYGKSIGMQLTKMTPYELKTFTDLVERYSTVFKKAKGNGRGKRKKKA